MTTAGFRETMAYVEEQDVRVVPASALAPEVAGDDGGGSNDDAGETTG